MQRIESAAVRNFKKVKELKRIVKSSQMMDFSVKRQGIESEKFSILIFKAKKKYG